MIIIAKYDNYYNILLFILNVGMFENHCITSVFNILCAVSCRFSYFTACFMNLFFAECIVLYVKLCSSADSFPKCIFEVIIENPPQRKVNNNNINFIPVITNSANS